MYPMSNSGSSGQFFNPITRRKSTLRGQPDGEHGEQPIPVEQRLLPVFERRAVLMEEALHQVTELQNKVQGMVDATSQSANKTTEWNADDNSVDHEYASSDRRESARNASKRSAGRYMPLMLSPYHIKRSKQADEEIAGVVGDLRKVVDSSLYPIVSPQSFVKSLTDNETIYHQVNTKLQALETWKHDVLDGAASQRKSGAGAASSKGQRKHSASRAITASSGTGNSSRGGETGLDVMQFVHGAERDFLAQHVESITEINAFYRNLPIPSTPTFSSTSLLLVKLQLGWDAVSLVETTDEILRITSDRSLQREGALGAVLARVSYHMRCATQWLQALADHSQQFERCENAMKSGISGELETYRAQLLETREQWGLVSRNIAEKEDSVAGLQMRLRARKQQLVEEELLLGSAKQWKKDESASRMPSIFPSNSVPSSRVSSFTDSSPAGASIRGPGMDSVVGQQSVGGVEALRRLNGTSKEKNAFPPIDSALPLQRSTAGMGSDVSYGFGFGRQSAGGANVRSRTSRMWANPLLDKLEAIRQREAAAAQLAEASYNTSVGADTCSGSPRSSIRSRKNRSTSHRLGRKTEDRTAGIGERLKDDPDQTTESEAADRALAISHLWKRLRPQMKSLPLLLDLAQEMHASKNVNADVANICTLLDSLYPPDSEEDEPSPSPTQDDHTVREQQGSWAEPFDFTMNTSAAS